MKRLEQLLATALVLLSLSALGCGGDRSTADAPGMGSPASCPCFSESEVKAASEKVLSEFRACAFNIAEIAVAEGSLQFEAVCTDCQYGTAGCYCSSASGQTADLTQDEWLACAHALLGTVTDIPHTCLPAAS